MPIELYSMRLSHQSRAVLMTAKQLNLDLVVIPKDMSKGEHLEPEYVKLNPSHSVPTLNDNGFVLWESAAMLQYLCNQYAPDSTLYPKEPKKRAVVDRWLNFDIAYNLIQRDVLFPIILAEKVPEDKSNALKNQLKLLDQLIGDKKYLTGDHLTIADLSVLATNVFLHIFKYDFSAYPNFERWYTRLSSSLDYFDEINQFSRDELEKAMHKYKTKLAQQK